MVYDNWQLNGLNGTFNELRSVKELADKVVLTCTECLSRNYTTEKNKKTNTQRLEIKKYCPKCGKHTLHKETKWGIHMSKEKKERTYSPSKVFKELKTVKWPTFKELMSSSGLVIVFTVLFGLYFFVCEVLSSGLVKMIVGA